MRPEHVGNRFDQMKGGLLGELQRKQLLDDLVVDPMARPDERWTNQLFADYARALRLLHGPKQIAHHQQQWGVGRRERYFAELDGPAGRDYFIDPDVGVATSKPKPEHVKPCEVLGLVQNGNVVAVYQHGSRYKSIEQRVNEVVEVLQQFQRSVECLAYMERQAAMLFLARQPSRLDNIAACLKGCHSAGSLKMFRAHDSNHRRAPENEAMPFLTRVKLSNYRSIPACDVALKKISFLVGPNGAGKSNFLDALRFVADALNLSLDRALRSRGGIDLVQRQPRSGTEPFGLRIQMELATSFGWYALAIGAQGRNGYEVRREECRLVDRQNGREHFFQVDCGKVVKTSILTAPPAAADRLYLVTVSGFKEFRPVFDALAGMRFSNPVPDRIRPIQAPGSTSSLNRDGSNIASVLDGLEKRSPIFKKRIDEYLGSIVPGIVKTGRWPKDTDETIEFWQEAGDGGTRVRLPASSMSDGTLRTLGILLALFQGATDDEPERQLVGIEEPEAALHPGAAEVLMDAIREAALLVQVLVTSHSAELLDGTPAESIIVVAADQEGTRLGALDEVSRSALQDRLFTAGELLRMDQLIAAKSDVRRLSVVDHLFGA